MVALKVVAAVLVRPWLWWTAVVQWGKMIPHRWWARSPFLPLPSADYMKFRLITQYGGDEESLSARMSAADVVDYLQWCKQWNRQS